MAKLLQNERTKLYKKPSTWVLSGVVILLMLSTDRKSTRLNSSHT